MQSVRIRLITTSFSVLDKRELSEELTVYDWYTPLVRELHLRIGDGVEDDLLEKDYFREGEKQK